MRTGARTTAGPGTHALLGGGMAVFGSGTPVSALLLSYLLLGEPFSFLHLAGMAGVLAGIAAITRSHAEG
jgi:drug/metabolite transporter (DMT)-like permease